MSSIANGKGFHQELKHSAENIDAWVAEMLKRADGQPIAIMLEQSRGALIYALMFRENVLLYPVNPKQLARYRESYPGGGKSDPTEAMYLARMLRERITTLTAWQPDDENTRLLAQLCQVHRRYACPKFLRQTFHEFADSARLYCPWTRARYRMLRDRGMKHHAAIRKLARSWIRILFRVWQTGTPFDCDRYIAQLKQRCPEITQYLDQEN